MNATKTATFWLVIVVSSFLLWQVVRSQSAQTIPEISYSEFLARVASGKVSKVTIAGSVVQGSDANGGSFRVIAPSNQSVMVESLQQHGVEIRFKETAEQGWPSVLLNLVPVFVDCGCLVLPDPPEAEVALDRRVTVEFFTSSGIENPLRPMTSVPWFYHSVFQRKGLE
jgi:hypothetical protein